MVELSGKRTNEPSALGMERLKPTGGNYREPTIIQAIKDDFFDKCYMWIKRSYINKYWTLAPHREKIDMIRKYNWVIILVMFSVIQLNLQIMMVNY